MFLVCLFLKLKVRLGKECFMITKRILELEVCPNMFMYCVNIFIHNTLQYIIGVEIGRVFCTYIAIGRALFGFSLSDGLQLLGRHGICHRDHRHARVKFFWFG